MTDFLRLWVALAQPGHARAWLAIWALAAAATFSWTRAVLLVVAVALGGCASLPSPVAQPGPPRRPFFPILAWRGWRLARRRPIRAHGRAFAFLPHGEEAFRMRLALIRGAEQTLDVQYYLIANDRTGHEFLAALRDAAARGVRVRILVDDLYATGEDALYAGILASANVDVRMFNPLPTRGESFVSRVAMSIHELSRINHRMHNKLLVADGAFAITGGRNIADEYFDRAGTAANFIDMDVLASGTIVADLERAFFIFWNSAHSYPLQVLIPGAGSSTLSTVPAASHASVDATTDPTWFAAGLRLVAADASLLADRPGKVDDGVGAVAAGHLALLEAAEREVIVSSPYFVPGDKAHQVLQDDLGRHVAVRILTNSLATTDEPIVHLGYARCRESLLADGATLSELMPDDDGRTPPAVESFIGQSRSAGRLHGKLAVVDGAESRPALRSRQYRIRHRHSQRRAFPFNQVVSRTSDRRAQLQRSTRSGRHAAMDDLPPPWSRSRSRERAGRHCEPGLATRIVARMMGDDML